MTIDCIEKILIAEDDFVSRRLLEKSLKNWGYQVVVVEDGKSALQALQSDNAPQFAILDWMMPGMTGVEVCKAVREQKNDSYTYIILLTALEQIEHMVEGFESGADDYVAKPFQAQELKARIKVGLRILHLQRSLSEHVNKLQTALDNINTLEGLLPICSYCKRVRDDKNYWMQVEEYISVRSNVDFSHSICPECYEKIVIPELESEEAKVAEMKKLKENES